MILDVAAPSIAPSGTRSATPPGPFTTPPPRLTAVVPSGATNVLRASVVVRPSGSVIVIGRRSAIVAGSVPARAPSLVAVSASTSPEPQVARYELRTSADELLGVAAAPPRRPAAPSPDRRFLRRLERLHQLSRRDQQALLGTIDAFLAKVS